MALACARSRWAREVLVDSGMAGMGHIVPAQGAVADTGSLAGRVTFSEMINDHIGDLLEKARLCPFPAPAGSP